MELSTKTPRIEVVDALRGFAVMAFTNSARCPTPVPVSTRTAAFSPSIKKLRTVVKSVMLFMEGEIVSTLKYSIIFPFL